jgi:ligand-binding sensor domain-containing protein
MKLDMRWLKTGIVLAAVLAIAAGIAVAVIFHDAAAALRGSRQQAAAAGTAFEEIRLDRAAPAGYELLGSPARFRDAVAFQGRLYLCGSAGLYAYDFQGVEVAHYRAGFELPSTKLLAVATAASVGAKALAPDGAGARDLYVATESEGLLIFDGQKFRQIRPRAASQRKLTAVLPLETGRVLVGTETEGVLVYDGRTLSPFHSALSAVHVTALAGNEGDLWVGTMDRGVMHWRGGEVETFTEPQGLPDPQVLSLAVDGTRAYVGTPLGVAEFEDGHPRRTLAEGVLAATLLVRRDSLAIGAIDEGTTIVPLTAHARATTQSLPARVERLTELDGDLYTLGEDSLYRNGKPVLQRESAMLTDGNISALAADSSGRLWVGYFDRGLDIVPSGAPVQQIVQHVEDEHVFCINRIVGDSERGVTAVATANGLILFDAAARPRQVLTQAQGLIANHVTDVLFNGNGMMIATPAGITIVDDQGMRSLYAFHGLVNNHVYTLARAGSQTLVGTLGGISVMLGDRPGARYTTANSALKHNWITSIADAGTEQFVGTYGGGIMRLAADGRMESIESGFEVNPNAMLVVGDRVYAGTLGRGLYIYDRTTGRGRFTTAGLPSANVTALASRAGVLYIGTENGLVKVAEGDIAQ